MAKPGGNSKKCELYKSQGRREINKQRKLRKIFKHQPNNLQVKALIK